MPPKRKSKETVEVSASENESEPSPPPKKKTTKASKKAESTKSKPSEGKSTSSNTKSAESDQFVDLGKKRRVTVSTFRSNVMVDIREFYGDEPDLKPGKKGISLTMEQWELLKANISAIDKLVEETQVDN